MNYAQYIIAGLAAVESLVTLLNQLRADAQASGAVTPKQDAQFAAQLAAIMNGAAWQPDSVNAPAVAAAAPVSDDQPSL